MSLNARISVVYNALPSARTLRSEIHDAGSAASARLSHATRMRVDITPLAFWSSSLLGKLCFRPLL